jgi:hypothetical protein
VSEKASSEDAQVEDADDGTVLEEELTEARQTSTVTNDFTMIYKRGGMRALLPVLDENLRCRRNNSNLSRFHEWAKVIDAYHIVERLGDLERMFVILSWYYGFSPAEITGITRMTIEDQATAHRNAKAAITKLRKAKNRKWKGRRK